MSIDPVAPPFVEQGAGAPLILLHAFPLDGRIWMPIARELANQYRVIVPDLRGFGKAHHQLGTLDEIPIELVARDIAALMEAQQMDRAVLGGISRGGYVALAFARLFPHRLQGLMLLDTRANVADQKERDTYLQMNERIEKEGIAFVPALMQPRFFGSATLKRNRSLVDSVDAIILSQDGKAIAAASRGMVNRPDALDLLHVIQTPTLAIAGEEDAAFENTKTIAAGIDGARFVPIADAGHLSVMEQPGAGLAAMRTFLSALVGASAKN